ncbi:glycosyltransferase [Kaistella sp.]|uniref:glycosyltransferase n=1 Tax=Kaistella sp. TaxID=2782235 RepID=UPI0035A003C4
MILIDTVFINNGGGKILMDYLFETIVAEKKKVTFLIDIRLKKEYENKSSENINHIFIDGFSERNRYYQNTIEEFSTILCFGNFPPTKKFKSTVYTYFHQMIFLKTPKEFSLKERLKFILKIQILRIFKKNSDYWIVQSELIKVNFTKKFKIKPEKILKIPFYREFTQTEDFQRIPNTFLYVSNASPHKNHLRLIDAFCRYYERFKKGQLTLTVSPEFSQVFQYIETKQKEGFPIINLGFVYRNDLYCHYRSSEYLIFPSLSESYGLGIVEAAENGCKVIGANLPYMFEVCNPSLVFNPSDTTSIYNVLCDVELMTDVPQTVLKTSNQIKYLINLLV